MHETRNAQMNVLDFYSEPEKGKQLISPSNLLYRYLGILKLLAQDFDKKDVARTSARV